MPSFLTLTSTTTPTTPLTSSNTDSQNSTPLAIAMPPERMPNSETQKNSRQAETAMTIYRVRLIVLSTGFHAPP